MLSSCQNCFDLALENLRRVIMQDTRGDVTPFMDLLNNEKYQTLSDLLVGRLLFSALKQQKVNYVYFQKIVLSENLLCHKNLPHTV